MTNPEDQTESIPGLLTETDLRLERLKTDIDKLDSHIQSMIARYEDLTRAVDELFGRVGLLERKTVYLAEVPPQRNCPHCGRKLPNSQTTVCPLCGQPTPL